MSYKKKLTMGAMTATLGLSLLGVGTWAAFNDVENVDASVAPGTLNLDVGEYLDAPYTFNISNLKPGDTMIRNIKLDNTGTLAIKDVLLSIDDVNFTDYAPALGELGAGDTDVFGTNTSGEYLEQFKVTLARTGIEGAEEEIIGSGDDVTLADIANGNDLTSKIGNHWTDGRINVASTADNEYQGIPVNPEDLDVVELSIEFEEYSVRDNRGVEEQNKYQGDSADITFTLEARQWDGQDVSDEDGYVDSNEQANNGN